MFLYCREEFIQFEDYAVGFVLRRLLHMTSSNTLKNGTRLGEPNWDSRVKITRFIFFNGILKQEDEEEEEMS